MAQAFIHQSFSTAIPNPPCRIFCNSRSSPSRHCLNKTCSLRDDTCMEDPKSPSSILDCRSTWQCRLRISDASTRDCIKISGGCCYEYISHFQSSLQVTFLHICDFVIEPNCFRRIFFKSEFILILSDLFSVLLLILFGRHSIATPYRGISQFRRPPYHALSCLSRKVSQSVVFQWCSIYLSDCKITLPGHRFSERKLVFFYYIRVTNIVQERVCNRPPPREILVIRTDNHTFTPLSWMPHLPAF